MVLASDFNPGSSPICSTLLMLNMGCTFVPLNTRGSPKGLTLNAAKALGIEDNVGSLVVGKTSRFLSVGYRHSCAISLFLRRQIPAKMW